MPKTIHRVLQATLASIWLLALAPGQAQEAGPQGGDPARWYANDTTPPQQLRTLHKEISAALREAQAECRRMAASGRAACLMDARATYRRDMAHAEQLRERAHPD
jgi:hypothetical protein